MFPQGTTNELTNQRTCTSTSTCTLTSRCTYTYTYSYSYTFVTSLQNHFCNHACTHRPAALSNRKSQFLLHGDRADQRDLHLHVVARHHHLHAFRQLHASRHRSEERRVGKECRSRCSR